MPRHGLGSSVARRLLLGPGVIQEYSWALGLLQVRLLGLGLPNLTTTEPAQPEKWGCYRELNPVSLELTRPTYHQATATCLKITKESIYANRT